MPALLILCIAGAVVLLDQVTKAWALSALSGSAPLTVVPGFFNLVLTHNTGGVFGLLSGTPSLTRRAAFAGATIVALSVIFLTLRRWGRESRLMALALALVAGGAVGNLIDRLRFGSVVDFIDWHWRSYHWYTFNVADGAISVGAVLLIVQSLLPQTPAPPAARSAPADPGPGA